VKYSMNTAIGWYANKTSSRTAAAGDDRSEGARRWSASREASQEMGALERNSDWYYSVCEPVTTADPDSLFNFWLLSGDYLPVGAPAQRAQGPAPQTERLPES